MQELATDPDNERYEQAGRISPDGHWLALRFQSNPARRGVRASPRWQRQPLARWFEWQAGGVRWGKNGRELLFDAGNCPTSVPVEVRGSELVFGDPNTAL
jgi:hypothetical protein